LASRAIFAIAVAFYTVNAADNKRRGKWLKYIFIVSVAMGPFSTGVAPISMI
jgi:hypothetical protein